MAFPSSVYRLYRYVDSQAITPGGNLTTNLLHPGLEKLLSPTESAPEKVKDSRRRPRLSMIPF